MQVVGCGDFTYVHLRAWLLMILQELFLFLGYVGILMRHPRAFV